MLLLPANETTLSLASPLLFFRRVLRPFVERVLGQRRSHCRVADVLQFNIVLGDTDVLVDSLQEWRRPDLADDRPPPLIIETYLDTAQLTQNQALVIVDDAGKRWDVADALASSADSSPRPTKGGGRHCEVVLERWKIELGDASSYTAAELNDLLPNVYKKGVVLFRSLFTFSRFLPAWKLHRKLGRQPGGYQGLRLRFRIRQEQNHESLARTAKDALLTPLCPSDTTTGEYDSIAENHSFDSLLCPAGPLSISVQYRTNTDFTVTDAEALLSSRFAGLDDGPGDGQQHFAGRSLPIHRLGHSRADSEASRSGSSQGGARVVQPTSLGAFAMTGKLTRALRGTIASQYTDAECSTSKSCRDAGSEGPPQVRGARKAVHQAASVQGRQRSLAPHAILTFTYWRRSEQHRLISTSESLVTRTTVVPTEDVTCSFQ